jgi:transcriptional regulator with XRE-family HTH domain
VYFDVISNRLDALRDKAGFTYKELAQKCNVSEPTIARICKGETADPSFVTVSNMIIACGGSIDELVGIPASGTQPQPMSDDLKSQYNKRIDELTDTNKSLNAIITAQTAATGKTTRFVLLLTAALIIAQSILDVVLFSRLL